MHKHINWRGEEFDLTDKEPIDCSQYNPAIVSSIHKTICGIIDAGYKGVWIEYLRDESTGKDTSCVLYDTSTIEGVISKAVLNSLPFAEEPCDLEEVLAHIASGYMAKEFLLSVANQYKGVSQ